MRKLSEGQVKGKRLNKKERTVILLFFIMLCLIVVALYTETGIRLGDGVRMTVSPAGSTTYDSPVAGLASGKGQGVSYSGGGGFENLYYPLAGSVSGNPSDNSIGSGGSHPLGSTSDVPDNVARLAMVIPSGGTGQGGSVSSVQGLLLDSSVKSGGGGVEAPGIYSGASGGGTAGSGGSDNLSGSGYTPDIAGVPTPVPEPSTLLLAGCGLAVTWLMIRTFARKSKR